MPSNRLSIMAKKKKNTGIPYEKLVQGIFQAIHDQEEVATITVEQNKTLPGWRWTGSSPSGKENFERPEPAQHQKEHEETR